MDATDIVIGIIIIMLLAWVSVIALNQNAERVAIADLYAVSEINKTLISLEEVCPSENGFELVEPSALEMQPYYVTAGKTDFNQTYFCFYTKTEQESA